MKKRGCSSQSRIIYHGSVCPLRNRTFQASFVLPDKPKVVPKIRPRASQGYSNPVLLAQGWRQQMADNKLDRPSELAALIRVTRPRVTQVLKLLDLPDDLQGKIAALGDHMPSPLFCERRLRTLLDLPGETLRQQIEDRLCQYSQASKEGK